MPGICTEGDLQFNPTDACGCLSCPHAVIGPATSGSDDVKVNGMGVLRAKGMDSGSHAACCGSNTWQTGEGSSALIVNGLPAVRLGDSTVCCGGGSPAMVTAKGDVFNDF